MPEDILNTWRKIGEKGIKLEEKWLETLNKKDSNIKSALKDTYIQSNLKDFENLIKKEKKKKNILNQSRVLQQDSVHQLL